MLLILFACAALFCCALWSTFSSLLGLAPVDILMLHKAFVLCVVSLLLLLPQVTCLLPHAHMRNTTSAVVVLQHLPDVGWLWFQLSSVSECGLL
jgi:hypothetical protein